jgi:hypothetical protein
LTCYDSPVTSSAAKSYRSNFLHQGAKLEERGCM